MKPQSKSRTRAKWICTALCAALTLASIVMWFFDSDVSAQCITALFLLSLPTLYLWQENWTYLSRKGRCPTCDYDRAGLDPSRPCPECGTSGTQHEAAPARFKFSLQRTDRPPAAEPRWIVGALVVSISMLVLMYIWSPHDFGYPIGPLSAVIRIFVWMTLTLGSIWTFKSQAKNQFVFVITAVVTGGVLLLFMDCFMWVLRIALS